MTDETQTGEPEDGGRRYEPPALEVLGELDRLTCGPASSLDV